LRETLIIAGMTTVSSSAIVAKILFDYRRTANRETELILGITMFEDVFLAVYLSLISGIVLSGASSFAGVASSGARLRPPRQASDESAINSRTCLPMMTRSRIKNT